jgi:hypothetical protein
LADIPEGPELSERSGTDAAPGEESRVDAVPANVRADSLRSGCTGQLFEDPDTPRPTPQDRANLICLKSASWPESKIPGNFEKK